MALPVYKLEIDASEDSDLQVDFVALVDRPAIEKNFIAFNEQKAKLSFAIDTDRHIISGPAMYADLPIYRNDDIKGEYMVVFDAPTIEMIAQKFFAKGYNQNFNLMHDPNMKPGGICIFESHIVDRTRGKEPWKGYEDAKDGSWFISAKVKNPAVWQVIKEGKVKGFSVEGIFEYEKKKFSEYNKKFTDEQLVEALKQIFSIENDTN